MKQKHPDLPRHIIKQQNGRYRDMKTMEWISIPKLASKCPVEPVNSEIKEEVLLSKRWDLNY